MKKASYEPFYRSRVKNWQNEIPERGCPKRYEKEYLSLFLPQNQWAVVPAWDYLYATLLFRSTVEQYLKIEIIKKPKYAQA